MTYCKIIEADCKVRRKCIAAAKRMQTGESQEKAYANIKMPCAEQEPIHF
jgi:hypothetical protein